MNDATTRLTLALIELDRERAKSARLQRSLGEASVECARLRQRLERYEPTPEVEQSTYGT